MITGWVVGNTYKKYKRHESSAKCVEVVDFYISEKSEREKKIYSGATQLRNFGNPARSKTDNATLSVCFERWK